MNTTVQRRPLSKVVNQAPQQLWDKHRNEYHKTSFNSNNKLSDKSSLSRSEQARSFSTSAYSVYPVRSSVLPLFAPTSTASSSSNTLFSFNFRASGFVWPLYKPPFVKMMSTLHSRQQQQHQQKSQTLSSSSSSIEEFVEKTFDFADKEFKCDDGVNTSLLSATSKCPFQLAATVELNKLRQALETNPEQNNIHVRASFRDDRNNFDLDDEEGFLRYNQKMFSRAEVLGGLGMNAEQEKLRRRNLLKAAAAAEIPHPLAFAWANARQWHYELGTILATDISGVVPVAVMEDHPHLHRQQHQEQRQLRQQEEGEENEERMSDLKPHFSDLITQATFEAVVEGHVPRSLPSARMEVLASTTTTTTTSGDGGGANAGSIFSRMMKNGKEEFSSSPSAASSSNSERSDDSLFLAGVELNQASIVRHGYYLQEPVTVVRWVLSGRNCARVSPSEVLNKIFSPVSASRKSRGSGRGERQQQQRVFVVGHPLSRMTHKYDIPIPMCCLRGIQVGEPNSSISQGENNQNHNHTHRIIALPRSPYASEEMIAAAPNSSRFADAVRKASLMDGYWTP